MEHLVGEAVTVARADLEVLEMAAMRRTAHLVARVARVALYMWVV
jgi:hypothetical protein